MAGMVLAIIALALEITMTAVWPTVMLDDPILALLLIVLPLVIAFISLGIGISKIKERGHRAKGIATTAISGVTLAVSTVFFFFVLMIISVLTY